MKINHQVRGDMTILLSEMDTEFLRNNGMCVDRFSFAPNTEVLLKPEIHTPMAEVDMENTVRVFLPVDATVPLVIERALIEGVPSNNRTPNFFFGEAGRILLHAQVSLAGRGRNVSELV